MKIGIYKITNPEGEIYVGQSKNIDQRFETYKNIRCPKQHDLYNSLKKYGWFNHKFEIIEECSIDELIEKEKYYIKLYNCVKEGLNKRGYGKGNGISRPEWDYPESAKKSKSKTMKEKWKNGEFKRKWSKSVKHTNTGETYQTMQECALKHNISHTKLLRLLGEGKEFSYI